MADADAEAPILWPPDAKIWRTEKDADAITNSMGMSLSKLQEIVKTGKPDVLQSTASQRVGHD